MGRNSRSTIIEVDDTDKIVQDLNETTVQTLFNECLANNTTKKQAKTILFPALYGYKLEDEILIIFDQDILEKNKKTIEYLYGQLKEIHDGNNLPSTHPLSVENFLTTYNGKTWTNDKGTLLKFLYLGCNRETRLIKPFSKEINATSINSPIKPTLSPKDPNFPAWWKEHKSEWEVKKKGGQEPADN